MLRLACFYDIGNVYPDPFSFNPGPEPQFFNDDAGMGLRIVLPIGGGTPLRLDYGVPISMIPPWAAVAGSNSASASTHPF